MKFRVDVEKKGEAIVIALPQGVYRAQLSSGNVEFKKKEVRFSRGDYRPYVPDISIDMDFDENQLVVSKPGCQGVMYYSDQIDIPEFDYKVCIEYLEMREGNIPEHNHKDGSSEVYVTVEEPYCGKVCAVGESQKSWAKKHIAVKIVPKRSSKKSLKI